MSERDIKSMDKEALVLHMKASREIQHFNEDSASWQRAFELYKQAGNIADMDCTRCRMKVYEWLNGHE